MNDKKTVKQTPVLLEAITKEEANNLYLGDLKSNILYAVGTASTLGLATMGTFAGPANEYVALNALIAIVAVLGFAGSLGSIYSRAKAYITTPNDYIVYHHRKAIDQNA